MHTPAYFNTVDTETFPGHLGIIITHVAGSEVRSEVSVKPALMAPNAKQGS